MVQVPTRSSLAAFGLALALAGCSVSPVLERLPESLGGLPADAPAPPMDPYKFPAVHDMPPPRATQPMTDQEQLDTEKALQAARDRQETQEKADDKDAPTAKKKALPAAKKKPAGSKNDGTDGGKASAKTNP